MILRDDRVPMLVLKAQRDPILRGKHCASAVYAEIYGYLSPEIPHPVKVREGATMLRMERGTFREALDLLEQQGWIRFSHRDARGIRHYVLVVHERGSNGPPFAAATPHA